MIYDLQKASILKRFSAFLLDFILICIVAVGIVALMSLITGFDNTYQQYEDIVDRYSQEYGIDLKEVLDDDATEEMKTKYKTALNAFSEDEEGKVLYAKIVNIIFLSISIGLFVAYLVVEFVVPLIFKNGQTVGKKVFSVGVMQVTGVRITPFILFVRSVLGKYTVETMVPMSIIFMVVLNVSGIIPLLVLLAIVILQIALLIATKTNSLIHDALSSTVVVDMATQMIFSDKESMIQYKEELHKAEAEKAEYK